LGQPEPAAEDYSRAIALDPKLVEAYFGRGVVRLMLNEDRAAVDDLTRAIDLKSDHALAYQSRAIGWHRLKQNTRAWEDVEECRKLGVEPPAEFIRSLEGASQGGP
jgi:tetratricopeptide (TPR) repeat protein